MMIAHERDGRRSGLRTFKSSSRRRSHARRRAPGRGGRRKSARERSARKSGSERGTRSSARRSPRSGEPTTRRALAHGLNGASVHALAHSKGADVMHEAPAAAPAHCEPRTRARARGLDGQLRRPPHSRANSRRNHTENTASIAVAYTRASLICGGTRRVNLTGDGSPRGGRRARCDASARTPDTVRLTVAQASCARTPRATLRGRTRRVTSDARGRASVAPVSRTWTWMRRTRRTPTRSAPGAPVTVISGALRASAARPFSGEFAAEIPTRQSAPA